jgi:hypothetical protein
MALSELQAKYKATQDECLTFKKELQKLYAPKAKIILQSVALGDASYLKHQDAQDNIAQAKTILAQYFTCGHILDDDFFK